MSANRFPTSIQVRATRPRADATEPLWRSSIAGLMATHVPPAPAPAPRTSAIRAGWICVSLGLAVAWFLPWAHFFFGLAVVMAIIALATHEVRAGFLLLAGTLAGSVLCTLIFLAGVAALLNGLFSPGGQYGNLPRNGFKTEPPRLYLPAVPSYALVARQAPLDLSTIRTAPMMATRPLRLEDIKLMLRAGLRDDEIVDSISDRKLVEPVRASEAAALRALGAGNHLLGYLSGCRWYVDPAPNAPPDRIVVASAAPPTLPLPPQAPAATPVDYAARDRQVQNLKQQIDALDDQISTIRTNPQDVRYKWHYAGSGNGGVNQYALQKYLDELDSQRTVLRREKWRLEGR